MNHQVTLIEGDGIGPEVIRSAVKTVETAEVDITWNRAIAGEKAIEKFNEAIPQETIDSIKKTKVALKGPVATPIGEGFRSANVTLRQKLILYACTRPVVNLPGIETRFSNVDLVVIRENTEGLYSGLEHQILPGVVTSLKVISREACRRIAQFAFDYCIRNDRKKVVAVHKASVMKKSDGLFLEEVRKAAENFPQIKYDEIAIDKLSMRLVTEPSEFDVLVMGNLYGDIISDLSSGLIGGLGVVPGANIGEEYAVFEPVHGTAPAIAGKGIANPLASILSAVLMLDHLGEPKAAGKIRSAVQSVLEEGSVKTEDLGGKAGTEEFTDAIIAEL
ncbi:MAG: isocitrate/isopropylmalate dehydrogenase family protein [Candidatus Marinimicrobia bacterium]|nr:isocitrate/isopropylmalate dehydrogenase family protein [Candidatus Neomarinimicrobiota bacterium]